MLISRSGVMLSIKISTLFRFFCVWAWIFKYFEYVFNEITNLILIIPFYNVLIFLSKEKWKKNTKNLKKSSLKNTIFYSIFLTNNRFICGSRSLTLFLGGFLKNNFKCERGLCYRKWKKETIFFLVFFLFKDRLSHDFAYLFSRISLIWNEMKYSLPSASLVFSFFLVF